MVDRPTDIAIGLVTLQIQHSCICTYLILNRISNASPATDWNNPQEGSQINEGELQLTSVYSSFLSAALRFTYSTWWLKARDKKLRINAGVLLESVRWNTTRDVNPRGSTQSILHTTSGTHLEINNEVQHPANPPKRESLTRNLQTKRIETRQRPETRGEAMKCDDSANKMMLGSKTECGWFESYLIGRD